MALFARANANTALLTNNCYLAKFTSRDVMLRTIVNYANKLSTSKKSSKWTCFLNFHEHCNITSSSQKNFIRNSHVVPHNKDYMPFGELLDRRRQEASRTILVQVQSANSHHELFAYCKQFGRVDSMHHYKISSDSHYFLVEFGEMSSVNAALESATHVSYEEVVPVQSPMVWFRNNRVTNGNDNKQELSGVKLSLDVSLIPDHQQIIKRIATVESISEQMTILYEAWKLEEVDIRMRFLTAHQLERCFLGFFPHLTVLPFGSSVNGFGKRGCDLDLVLNFEQKKLEKPSSRFVFHSKLITNDSKMQSKKFLETIADTMQYFIPGISNVRKILQARVPIIKFDQRLTGLECDLSMTNETAVHMAELLCFYGEVDYRVRPLIFTIRQWACRVGITNPNPGRWLTNFSITLLVLFYLQQKRIVPSLNELERLAGKSNYQSSKHSVNCTFLRDVTKLPIIDANTNNDNLETLLLGFFEYYSTYDFSTSAISLREGESLNKPNLLPLYICNPLETKLNVSKNVSAEETERFKSAVRNALWILESAIPDTSHQRGILSIFQEEFKIVDYVRGKRKVNVAALFGMSDDGKESPKSQKKTEEVEAPNACVDLDSESKGNGKKKKKRARPC